MRFLSGGIGIMLQFVSQHYLEWLPWLFGGAALGWLLVKVFRYVFPAKRRRSLYSDRRNTPRRSDRRQLGEP